MCETRDVGKRVPLAYPIVLVAFLAVMAWRGLLRIEHILVAAVVVGCFASESSKRFVVLLMPMALVGIFYDVQKVFSLNLPVHVAGPYFLEKMLFGIPSAEGRITLNEFF